MTAHPLRLLLCLAGLLLLISAPAMADRFQGTVAGEDIFGTRGSDIMEARGGNDFALGLAGGDLIDGGPGEDTLWGDGVCPAGATLASYCFPGGNGADTVLGGSGNDMVFGHGGKDRLAGETGDDTVNGDAGADRLSGNDGNDVLVGATGSDRLIGGPGRDRIDAGTGRDRISVRDGVRDVVDCGPGRDRVTADKRDRLTNCEVRRVRRPTPK